jgi:hypothetical protein
VTPKENENTKGISATDYVRANFLSSDRLAVLARNASRGETVQRITSATRIVEPSFQEWLHYKNEKEFCDIYIGMNTLKPEARTRTKEDIHLIRHLYLDVDHDGPAALGKIQQSNLLPTPSYTLSTSPGRFQVVWRVENISPDHAEYLLRLMARKFGGDPAATDSTRVLRLPGFVNRKYASGPEFVVHAQQDSNQIYHLQDFTVREDSPGAPRHPRDVHHPNRLPTAGRKSQSEHDWAYANRALARGDDPELVVQRIADFRASDKTDPQYYARHTVRRALSELVTGKSDPSTTTGNTHLEGREDANPDTTTRERS